jgi:hypothetical protein
MVRAAESTLVTLLLGALATAAGRAETPTEYQVKAAFLYNFAKFVRWPTEFEAEKGTFVITILGQDPFGTTLDETLRGKTIDDRQIVLRRVSRAEDVGPSQILFISDSEKDRLPAILKHVGTRPVLTVGEMSRFTERGGVIRFKVDEDRIRLEINVAAAEQSRLRISSQLLKLAQIVNPSKGG